MTILFKIISAFLYFNFVPPVLMYYIYDDNPNIGFMAVENSVGTYMNSGFSAAKKQFTQKYSNPKFPKINSENVVDTHFKVGKTLSRYTIPSAVDTGRLRTHEAGKNKAQRIVEEYRNTEAPKQWQQQSQHQQMVSTGQQDKQITQIPNKTPVRGDYGAKPKEAASHTQPLNNQQIPPIRPKSVNPDYSNSMKQRNQDAGSSQKIQETERSQRNLDVGRSQRQKAERRSQNLDAKPITYVNVQMNVRKPQISADPQKNVLLNNNRQMSSLTALTARDKRQRMPISMMVDKTLHKTNGIAHDHNMRVMSRVLDDMTKKIANRRHKQGVFVNRDTEKQLDILYEKRKRSVVADNMRKYIGKDKIGKDLRNQNKRNTARIGSHEETLELDDIPYAVFYRMNPETLDRQEGFIIMGSMENNRSSEIASKENRPHTAFEEDTENMTNKHKSINNGKTIQRKMLKNFSNYRNL